MIIKNDPDVYFDSLMYLISLIRDRRRITREINRAVRLNFPDACNAGVGPDYRIDIAAKLRETAVAITDPKTALPRSAEQNGE